MSGVGLTGSPVVVGGTPGWTPLFDPQPGVTHEHAECERGSALLARSQ